MSHSLVFFEKENYLLTKYEWVKEARIIQVFFLTFLIIYQKGISYNHDVG